MGKKSETIKENIDCTAQSVSLNITDKISTSQVKETQQHKETGLQIQIITIYNCYASKALL